MSKPHVCPKCNGNRSPLCHPCRGSGVVWEPSDDQKLVDAIGKILPIKPQIPDIDPRYPNPGDVPPVVPYTPLPWDDPLNPWIVVGSEVSWDPVPETHTDGVVVNVSPTSPASEIARVIRNTLASAGFTQGGSHGSA